MQVQSSLNGHNSSQAFYLVQLTEELHNRNTNTSVNSSVTDVVYCQFLSHHCRITFLNKFQLFLFHPLDLVGIANLHEKQYKAQPSGC